MKTSLKQARQPAAERLREKTAEQISQKDRRQAETLAQRFTPTLERPIDDGQARLVAPKAPPNR